MQLIGADTGGTFTDLVKLEEGRMTPWKVPSTPDDFARGVLTGIDHLASGAPPFCLVHATTVATNALLERTGARVGLVVTEGFRDLLEIGRQDRPELYNLYTRRPSPLVPASRRFTLRERVDAQGRILTPLREEALDRLIQRLRRVRVDSVAVCLLFSFLNPRHERAVGRALRRAGFAVSLSSDILPEFREVERASTTAINAYVAPVMTTYLRRLEKAARKRGAARVRVVQSNGGRLSVAAAGRGAVHTLLSGPAAGVAGAAFAARDVLAPRATDRLRLITFDMGGTSTDVSLVDGTFSTTTEGGIGGLPAGIPMIDIHTVGAGGGSLAHVDAGGLLRVGPESAGARPGPACYGVGGHQATVTDANLVLGRLSPAHFLGGRMPLDPDRAEAALATVARQLGSASSADTAAAIVRVVNAHMERAIRLISVERGHDPRDFTLVSFGGAGGLHACDLAEGLRIPRVLLPRHPGVLSAIGALAEDVIKDESRTIMRPGDQIRPAQLARLLAPMERRLRRDMDRERDDAGGDLQLQPAIDLRYQGQSYELTIPLDPAHPGAAAEAFHEAHRHQYGHADPDRPLEWVTLRLRAVLPVEPPVWPTLRRGTPRPPGSARAGAHGPVAILRREALLAGNQLRGPALLLEDFSTFWLPAHWTARVHPQGHLLATADPKERT